MAKYILNQNQQDSASGANNELHDETPGACNRLPLSSNRLDVGYFSNCGEAMAEARRKYPSLSSRLDGCYYCCPTCHSE
ncbi:hypothetical protein [Bauldia litoralis]|uniref:Uncharacterized protein n=1 Tax=Bauldia litoralis TaxID=665467 RepID=A0A1G6BLN3_9HYPH|nr:hypothetical protein [Bauldia litoralis]SDB21512.1 hypothetical protein SAMN02982931_01602 [Bauldia litoralis]